jgi:hypothetical protein
MVLNIRDKPYPSGTFLRDGQSRELGAFKRKDMSQMEDDHDVEMEMMIWIITQ